MNQNSTPPLELAVAIKKHVANSEVKIKQKSKKGSFELSLERNLILLKIYFDGWPNK